VRERELEFGNVPKPVQYDVSNPFGAWNGIRQHGESVEGSMDQRKYLTAEEVSERYRGGVSVGTLRNWRAMRIGPTFIKIGKAVLYPIDELEAWDQKNTVACRASKRPNTDARDDA